MKIESITVSYGVTQSLPEYNNIKTSVTLAAALDADDDPTAVHGDLLAMIKAAIHAEVDTTMEAHDLPARYSTESRFQVVRTYQHRCDTEGFSDHCVAILPDACSLPRGYDHIYDVPRGVRYGYAVNKAWAYADVQNVLLIDCSDGDLSRLPVLRPVAATPQEEDDGIEILTIDEMLDRLEDENGIPDADLGVSHGIDSDGHVIAVYGVDAAGQAAACKAAQETAFLRWFYTHSDFGPSDSEVQAQMKARFVAETGLALPAGYEDQDDTEILGTDADLGGWE